MTTATGLTRPNTISVATSSTPLLVPLLSPVRAMKAYASFRQIKRLDARQLADVGMTAAERDAVTYMDVFATA